MGKEKELLVMAKKIEACKAEMAVLGKTRDEIALYNLYWDNVVFCVASNFPPPEWIKRNMPDAARHGLVVGGTTTNLPDRAVLLKGAKVSVVKADYKHYRYWLRQNSSIKIEAANNSLVVIDLYDNATAKVSASGNALVRVFVYNKNKVTITGGEERVRVIKKGLITGK